LPLADRLANPDVDNNKKADQKKTFEKSHYYLFGVFRV